MVSNESCVFNFANCEKGFSVAVFFKMVHDVTADILSNDTKVHPADSYEKAWPRQYILSTGDKKIKLKLFNQF